MLVRNTTAATVNGATTARHDHAAPDGMNVPWNAPIAYVAKNIWPQKTIENFAAYIGAKPRTAQYILHSPRKTTMRVDFVVRMLTGKYGQEFLKAFMSESDAEWWQRIVELEKQQAENEKALSAIREAIGNK
jgi:hypothetical protein